MIDNIFYIMEGVYEEHIFDDHPLVTDSQILQYIWTVVEKYRER